MMNTITVRKMDFEFSDDMDLVFIQHDPRLSFLFLGTWMLLPYLEPYLMRTIRKAMEQVDDAALLHDMQQFCAQEGQHYQQHAKANEKVRDLMPVHLQLKLDEKLTEIRDEYKSFSEQKDLDWNLAYAEGFEAYTAAGARAQMSERVFDYMKDPIRDLMLWHIMEEMEHRTVAFDVFEALCGKYWYRLRVGLWAQKHFTSLGAELTQLMIEAFPDLIAQHQNSKARYIREQNFKRYRKATLKNLPGIYSPWYSPHKLSMPAMYEETRQAYTKRAISTS
ncbi:MAG: metal-dependent hydrolase [bacterium]